MKPLIISSFKYGQDDRREILSRQPGTLILGENVHVTQGGEIQKRKSFVRLGAIASSGSTFGLEVTSNGLAVFGAVAAGSVTLTGGLGTVYQQLIHPAVSEGVAYDVAKHQISSVKTSCSFDGNAFVSATFADGKTYLYYVGSLVKDSRDGIVLADLTSLASLSTELAEQVNDLDLWEGTANKDSAGNTVNGSTIVKSPVDTFFTPVPEETSTSGTIGGTQIDIRNAGTDGARARSGFQLTGGAGTLLLEAPAQSTASTPTVQLTNGYVTVTGVVATDVASIAASVNERTSIHGYTALTNAALNSVFVYAPTDWGTAANSFNLTITTTGLTTTGAAGVDPVALTTVMVPDPLDFVAVVPSVTGPGVVQDEVYLGVGGGTAPYTFRWRVVPGTGPGVLGTNDSAFGRVNKIECLNPTSNQPQFRTVLPRTVDNVTYCLWRCDISDSATGTAIVYLNVSFRYVQSIPAV